MKVSISETKDEMGRLAAQNAAELITQAINKHRQANIILATGASQFEMLSHLVKQPGIDWSKVVMFHLDEYVGLPITHPASFRKYLKERFVDQLPPLKAVHFVEAGKGDAQDECDRINKIISGHPIHAAMLGIGENGHLAFNDPPADFDTDEPYIVVTLDADCRKQQVGEGWFATIDDVPTKAISMSIKHIMKSAAIVVTCPDERKAVAVRNALNAPVTNKVPSSILQHHLNCSIFLDNVAASLLAKEI